MRFYKAILPVAIWSVSWCQEVRQAPPSKATPDNISISCHVNPDSRTVEVQLMNRTATRVYAQYVADVDARSNYEVIATNAEGKRLPKTERPKLRPFNSKSSYPIPQMEMSILLLHFDPHQQRNESFSLAARVQIPKQGGEFRIQIGRELFLKPQSEQLDPAQILWCKPVDVVFPPLNLTAINGIR